MRAIVLLLLSVVVMTGCALRAPDSVPVPESSRLAVAGFTQPQENWQFLAGYSQAEEQPVSTEMVSELNTSLLEMTNDRFPGRVLGPHLTSQCREVVVAETDRTRLSALEFWVQVGRCLPADYLLVPQIFSWQERHGGQWGSDAPAKVVMEMYLIDVEQAVISKRYRYDEQQQSLSENLFSLPRFLHRQGKWLRAEELAREGMRQGLEALGI